MVILSRPHVILTVNQWASEATETRKASSEQRTLGIPPSLHELGRGSQLCTNSLSCLQGGMWTSLQWACQTTVGLLATLKFLLLCYSTDRHHKCRDHVEALQFV